MPSVGDFTDPLRTSFSVVVVVFGVSLVPGLCGGWIVLLFSCNITFVLTQGDEESSVSDGPE